MINDRADLIYWEPQTAALCGVHALNTLLQGPYFSEIDLAQIAHELDKLEHQLMMESGVESADFLQFMAEESGNVADHGMFSLQVLDKALEVWGLRAVNINSPEAAVARVEPQHQTAFVLNLREHWFTIREIYGQWWNLNSVFSAPEPLSQFYLSAFLGTLLDQGYSIFVIKGQLPVGPHPDSVVREGPGRWFTPEEAREEAEKTQKLKQQGFLQAAYSGVLCKASALGNLVRLQGAGSKRPHDDGDDLQGGDDPDLARALVASLADRDELGAGAGPSAAAAAAAGAGGRRSVQDDEDADLAAAIAASLAEHAQQQQQQQQGQQEDDAAGSSAVAGSGCSMEQAKAAGGSLSQHGPAADGGAGEPSQALEAPTPPPALAELGPEPEPGVEGAIEVGVRLPDGSRHTRRFLLAEHSVGHVAAFAASKGADMARHRLALRFPRRALANLSQPLLEAGVQDKEMLSVEQC